MVERLLRLKDVLKQIPVSQSTWWAGVNSGKFPKPRRLGERSTVWLGSEIDALIDKIVADNYVVSSTVKHMVRKRGMSIPPTQQEIEDLPG